MSLFTTDGARPLGKGLQSPAGSVRDSEVSTLLRNYKRSVASRYRAIVRDELESTLRGPLLVSPKIDGEIWFLVLDGKESFFASPSGRVISGDVPALKEATAAAGKAHERSIIAGELFAARKSGRPRVGDLAAAMGGEAKAEVERIAFAAFDSLQGGHQDSPRQMPIYGDRLQSLQQLFDGGKRVKAIRTESVEGAAPVSALFDEWVEGGKGEGLVIRTAENLVFKAKPTIDIDAVIIGYTESSEGPDRVGSLLLGLMREDGQLHLIGACGNMPTEQRLAFMQSLKETHVASNYRYANSKGALYHFVRPEVVIQIKVTDIQSEDSSGGPIDRMVLEYTEQGWKSVRQLPGVSILHPVFVRIRDDKQPNPVDIRISQVLERCLVDGIDRHAEPLVLPVSEVIRREVYAKTMKGETAVRKVLLWQTNKQSLDPSYPAFVVHFTDYSAGRKDPLKREVRVAPSLDDAQKIADELVSANIKKGWDRRS